jgi:hypothetical protein
MQKQEVEKGEYNQTTRYEGRLHRSITSVIEARSGRRKKGGALKYGSLSSQTNQYLGWATLHILVKDLYSLLLFSQTTTL